MKITKEMAGRWLQEWLESPREAFLLPPSPAPTGDGMLALALAMMAAKTSRRRDYLSSLDTRPWWAVKLY